MAKTKPTLKKTAPVATPAPAAPAAEVTRNRGAVLVKKTASELHDLIGDTPIGVSNKELKAIVLEQRGGEILKDAGLK